MTEIVRMRERADRARRMLGIDRRKFVTSAGMFAAGLLADQAFEITAVDPIKEHFAPDPRSMTYTNLAPERFASMASVEMQGALMCWQQGRSDYQQIIAQRCTQTYRGEDGRRWMKSQGEGIRLFGREPLRMTDIPLVEQPDREYAAWAEERLDRCELGDQPLFQKCRGVVRTDDGPVVQTYLALLLPRKGGAVDSVTMKVV